MVIIPLERSKTKLNTPIILLMHCYLCFENKFSISNNNMTYLVLLSLPLIADPVEIWQLVRILGQPVGMIIFEHFKNKKLIQ